MKNFQTTTDYLFIGAGASAILILLSMEKRSILLNKHIVIFDPVEKNENDKTFCFWYKNDLIDDLFCKSIVSKQWSSVSISRENQEQLSENSYLHIASKDLYAEFNRLCQTFNITVIKEFVNSVELVTDSAVCVKSDATTWNAQFVFDARSPVFEPPKKNHFHLYQSFYGFIIESKDVSLDQNCIELMDFNIPQNNSTQFMYVLPYDTNKALVEVTRFGSEIITQFEADILLKEYIATHFKKYTVLATEVGCIPMFSSKIIKQNLKNVIPIGANGGAIKPSTGYAFKNMLIHAEEIASSLETETPIVPLDKKKRFKLYDRLLLQILSQQPNSGKKIFEQLFQRNKVEDVFKFLDEQTTVKEEVRIFKSLPIVTFVCAFFKDIFYRVMSFLPELITLSIASLFLIFKSNIDSFQYIFLFLGLLFIGIPHGAVDQLVFSKQNPNVSILNFSMKYVSIGLIYYIIWILLPLPALILFLTFSVWHFGQGDVKHWELKKFKALKSWIWGSVLLFILLFSHLEETNNVFNSLNVPLIPFKSLTAQKISFTLFGSALIWSVLEKNVKMILAVLTFLLLIYIPLLPAFSIYFICQHSYNSWTQLKTGLRITNKQLYIKSMPYTIAAFFGFFLLITANNFGLLENFNQSWIAYFYVFVACISLPHIFIILLHNNKK